MAKGAKKDKVETAPAVSPEVKAEETPETTPETTPEVTPETTPEKEPEVTPEVPAKAPKAAKASKEESNVPTLSDRQKEVLSGYPEHSEIYLSAEGGIFIPNGMEKYIDGLIKVKNPHYKAK